MRKDLLIPLLLLASVAACKSRDPIWDRAPSIQAEGLDMAAALLDPDAERVLMLTAEDDLTLTQKSLPMGRGFASSATTRDGRRLFVLTHGDQPRKKPSDQKPRLSVVKGGADPSIEHEYALGDPLSGIGVDPTGDFAVVYPTAADEAFVQNPNELAIVDLAAAPSASNPAPVTLRSFGGRPRDLLFTEPLALTGDRRRLLVVQTDRDVGLLELAHPELGNITVPLSTSGGKATPAQVAVYPGDPGADDGARLAVRLAGDSNIVLVDLVKRPNDQPGSHDFWPTPNIVVAGGTPSDVAFVRTDGGVRLAATVPSKQALVLIDPSTGIPTSIDVGAPLDRIAIVTSSISSDFTTDVALLWSTQSASIAFVELGQTIGKPYKSIQLLNLDSPISAVLDVPPPNDRLKVLVSSSYASTVGYFVLDLGSRTASPILSQSRAPSLAVSPSGKRAWITAEDTAAIADLELDSLHPRNLALRSPIARVFDVGRKDGGRALVALFDERGVGATVLDGSSPSLETAVDYEGLLLGSLP